MKEVTVSVIMAAYNSAATIGRAIESLLAQSLSDWELVVVDDASTDRTAAVVKGYRDPRIVLLQNEENRGAGYSRNRAVKASSGTFLAILDADDEALPERFAIQTAALQRHSELDAVASRVIEIDADGKPLSYINPPRRPEEVHAAMLFRCSVVHSSAMIRRSFFVEKNLFYREDYPCSQDFEMWSRAVSYGRVATLPEFLTRYRTFPSQMSSVRKTEQTHFATLVYSAMLTPLHLEEEVATHMAFVGFATDKCQSVKDALGWGRRIVKQNRSGRCYPQRALKAEVMMRIYRFSVMAHTSHLERLLLIIHLQHTFFRFFPFCKAYQRKQRYVKI